MNVAYIGIKGLPSQGGAERVVEAIVSRMPAFGVKPTVYCDWTYTPEEFSISGVDLIRLPALSGKHLRSTSLAMLSALHVLARGKYDLVHLHNIEASFVLPFLRWKYPIVSTSHGFAYRRDKWGPLAKKILQSMEAPFVGWSHIPTAVSAKDAEDLSERYQREIQYIPNGVGTEYTPDFKASEEILKSHGMRPGEYWIFVAGRIIPTKGVHLAIEAINRIESNKQLLIVGDDTQSPVYTQELRRSAGPDVRFQGLISNRDTLFGLMKSAELLIFPSTVEAMSMVLLEAAFLGIPIVCSDIPENRQVMGDGAIYFISDEISNLVEKLSWATHNPERCEEIALRARDRVQREYSWDGITARYVEIYKQLCLGKGQVIEDHPEVAL